MAGAPTRKYQSALGSDPTQAVGCGREVATISTPRNLMSVVLVQEYLGASRCHDSDLRKFGEVVSSTDSVSPVKKQVVQPAENYSAQPN